MTERKLSYEYRVELALDRLERRIYSLNYDGYFTKSFFNEFEEVLGLVAAFRLFFLDSEVKIHAYHSKPNVLRNANSNNIIATLLDSFQSYKKENEYSIVASDLSSKEYPGAKSKIEIKVCSCDEYCSLVSCDDSPKCENGAIPNGLIILYSKKKSYVFNKFFVKNKIRWFKELQDLFKKNEEPMCFGKLTECKKVCSKWKNRCFTKKNTDNIFTLDLDAVVQQLREKFQEVLSREVVADGQADVPVLLYNPKTRFLTYRATNYLEYPKRDNWKKFKDNVLKIEPICIKTAVSLSYDLLESEKKIKELDLEKNEVKRLQTKIDDYIKDRQKEYVNITTKLNNCGNNYDVFCKETLEFARNLIAATIQRVDTGLTRDVWGSFENFSVPANLFSDEATVAIETLSKSFDTLFKESEKLREFCECLFFKKTDDREKQSYVVTPLGYLGQKIGMIFTVLNELSVKDCERKFNNIAREFASLLFRSLQAQAYRETLRLLDVRHPKEAINILCEVLPLVFNITAIVFHMADANNEKIIYGFPSANEGEIFDRLDKNDAYKTAVDDLIKPYNKDFANNCTYEVTSYSTEGKVYSSKQYVNDDNRKIRTRSRLLLDIDPEKQKNLPIKKGTLDIFFDLSDYSLRRNAPDIVREIIFIADLIFEAACQKHVVMQKSLKSAVSAIMGRNLSHNIGSHVLARYSSAVGRMNDQRNSEAKGTEDHRSVFLRYLQRRMDFIAEVATAEKSFWSQPIALSGVLSALNLDKELERINGEAGSPERLSFKPILLSYITGKEGMNATVDAIAIKDDPYFACPGGEMGAHALYVILENIIRNSARHNIINKGSVVDSVTVKVNVKEIQDRQDLWCFTIIDCQSEIKENSTTIADINNIITKEPILNQDGSPNPKYWGIREMQICAQYLRGLPMSDLEGFAVKPPGLKAIPHAVGKGTKKYLAYRIYLQKAKLCAVIPAQETLKGAELSSSVDEINKKLKPKGIEILLSVSNATQLQGYSFVMVEDTVAKLIDKDSEATATDVINKTRALQFKGSDKQKPIPLLQLPVRTMQVDTPFMKERIEELNKGNANIDPEDWLEPLHERLWTTYHGKRVKWKDKTVKALVGWQNDRPWENIIEKGKCPPDQLFCHARIAGGEECDDSKPEQIYAYNCFGDAIHQSGQLGCAWVDHANKNHFSEDNNPNLISASENNEIYGQPFIFSEFVENLSPHLPLLSKQAIGTAMGNELVAAALARVIVLDERVQNEIKREYRGLGYKVLWPCMGVWVPDKTDNTDVTDVTDVKVTKHNEDEPTDTDLNQPDFDGIKKFLQKPVRLTEQFPPDFIVLHLTILENLKKQRSQDKCEADTLAALIEGTQVDKNCEIVIVTGRGAPSLSRHNGDVNALPTRYLPISALLEYLLARPSKLALMRALWSAAAAL